MSDGARLARLNQLATLAVKHEGATQVPAACTVAVWAVESEWGAAPVGKFNCFGIKRAARHALWCLKGTREWFTPAEVAEWNRKHPDRPAKPTERQQDGKVEVLVADEFADYPSLDAAVDDFTWLISAGTPYASAWKAYLTSKDLGQLLTGIARQYSTEASYALLVTAIAGQANVAQAIAAARQA